MDACRMRHARTAQTVTDTPLARTRTALRRRPVYMARTLAPWQHVALSHQTHETHTRRGTTATKHRLCVTVHAYGPVRSSSRRSTRSYIYTSIDRWPCEGQGDTHEARCAPKQRPQRT
jgi:hypothetical protein